MTIEEYNREYGPQSEAARQLRGDRRPVYTSKGYVSPDQYTQLQANPGKPKSLGMGALAAALSLIRAGQSGGASLIPDRYTSSWLSELGAVGGGTGGAALVAPAAIAAAPVTGGLSLLAIPAAGAIGSYVGGTSGRLVENKVRDDRGIFDKSATTGKTSLQEANKEGLWSTPGGALGGLARAAQVAPAGAGGLFKVLGMSGPQYQAATKASGGMSAATARSLGMTGPALEGSQRAAAKAYNLLPGTKVGKTTLSSSASKSLTQHVDDVTKNLNMRQKANPEQVLGAVEAHRTTTGKQIGDLVAKSDRTLTPAEIKELYTSAKAAVKVSGLSGKEPTVRGLLKDVRGVKTLSDVQKINLDVGPQAHDITSPTASRIAMRRLDTELGKFLTGKVEGLSELNKAHSLSKQALPFLSQNIGREGLNIPIGVSKFGQLQVGGRAGSIASGTISRAGAGLANAVQPLMSPAGLTAGGVGVAGIGRALQSPAPTLPSASLPSAPGRQSEPAYYPDLESYYGAQEGAQVAQAPGIGGYGPMSPGQSSPRMTQPQQSQNSQLAQALQMAMIRDLEETGGKRIPALKSVYEVVASGEGGGGSGLNVTKVTSQQYTNALSGYQSLQQLEALLAQDPKVLDRSATPGRQLPVVGGYIARGSNTGDFDALAYNTADKYLRITTGAQANESEIRNLATKIMPRAGDSPQTVRTKVNALRAFYGNILGLAGADGIDYEETPQANLAGAI